MPRILTQKDFSANKKLDFCYICGNDLDNGEPTDVDHCPPKSIFNPKDRTNYPIILKVHKKCHHEKLPSDEILSVLFDPLSKQGKVTKDKHQKQMEKRKVCVSFPSSQLVGYTDLPLKPFGSRIAQCMHAILYKQYFPNGVIKGEIRFPFAEVSQEGEVISEKFKKQSLSIAKTIACSIKADKFDCVIAYNKQFKYVCCWSPYDDVSVCLFAFDIMNMSQIAITITGLPKVVIGHYFMEHPDSDYSKATTIEMPLSSAEVEYPLPSRC